MVAGALRETTGWVFAAFVVNSAKYATIYSVFAGLILFMIWAYAGWQKQADQRTHFLDTPTAILYLRRLRLRRGKLSAAAGGRGSFGAASWIRRKRR